MRRPAPLLIRPLPVQEPYLMMAGVHAAGHGAPAALRLIAWNSRAQWPRSRRRVWRNSRARVSIS
jgi:hypothetical protein